MTAVIIEDEQLIAKELQLKVFSIAPDIQILTVLPSLKTAFRWFMENAEPDIIFADIQLNDGVSFEIFKRFQLKAPIIFTTAYDEFALQAFKVNGQDYLLKPVDEEELQRAIAKVRAIVKSREPYPHDLTELLKAFANPSLTKNSYKEKFIVRHRNAWIPFYAKEVAFFYRDQINYLIGMNGEKYILDYGTLEEIEEVLDPKNFFRANRQFIIHFHAIQSFKSLENQKLVVTLLSPNHKEVIDISREKAPAFKKWMEGGI